MECIAQSSLVEPQLVVTLPSPLPNTYVFFSTAKAMISSGLVATAFSAYNLAFSIGSTLLSVKGDS